MAGTLARCKGYDPTRFYISQECSRGLRKEPGRGLGLTKVLFHLVPTLFMVYLVYLIGNINTLPVIFFCKGSVLGHDEKTSKKKPVRGRQA